jgi:hypothetical protein
MPIFYYIATFEESMIMLEKIFKEGFRVIPNQTYEQPHANEYNFVTDELTKLLHDGPGIYLSGPFTRFSPCFQHLDSGPASGKYVIDLLTQGPLLQALLARLNYVQGVPTLLLGFVSCQKEFKNPENGRLEPASPEVKGAYRLVVSTMKKSLMKHALAKEFPIGSEALQLVQEGKAVIKETFLPASRGQSKKQ